MKIRNRFANWLLALVGVGLLRILFLTTRLDHRVVCDDATTVRPPSGKRRYSFCMWHDGILLALVCAKAHQLCGLISRHQDGTYLSYAARMRVVQRSTPRSASRLSRHRILHLDN